MTLIEIDNRIIINVVGRFDHQVHRQFKELSEAALKSDKQLIEISLLNTDYIDSSALGMLLFLRDKSKDNGKSVEITNVRNDIRKVFDVAVFHRLFNIRYIV